MNKKIIIRSVVKKWQIQTSNFTKIVKADNWKEAIRIAFTPEPPKNLGLLTRIRIFWMKQTCPNPRSKSESYKFLKWNYIDSVEALKIAGYSIENK